LEEILSRDEEVEIEILPNGEVRQKGSGAVKKPLTMREDLGGEYSRPLAADELKTLGQVAFEHVHRASLNKNNFCVWANRSDQDQAEWNALGKSVADFARANDPVKKRLENAVINTWPDWEHMEPQNLNKEFRELQAALATSTKEGRS
jgi:hypothetical protein